MRTFPQRLIISLCVCLAASLLVGQEPLHPRITDMKVVPSEPIPPGTCTSSRAGYLDSEKTHSTVLDDTEIGKYINSNLKQGYTITIYPRTKNGIFVYLDCNRGDKPRALESQ